MPDEREGVWPRKLPAGSIDVDEINGCTYPGSGASGSKVPSSWEANYDPSRKAKPGAPSR